MTTYEAGIKSDWYNRKLRVNADVFYNDYSDLQATALDPSTGVSQRFNAAGAHTWGVELETSARPLSGLSLSANVAYLHAVYDDFVNAGGAGTNAAGKYLTYSPQWNASAAIGYVLPIASLAGAWKVNADIQFQTSSYANPMNTDPFKIPTQKNSSMPIPAIPRPTDIG